METFNLVKNLFVTICSVCMAYFAPINDMVFVIFFIFLVNCIAGIIAGIVAKGEHFSLRKFFHCLVETLVFYFLVLVIFIIGERMKNLSGAVQCITGVVYAILYFYGTNVIRNLRKLFPDSRVINFLYYIVSFEIVRKIPYLQTFLDKEKYNENN